MAQAYLLTVGLDSQPVCLRKIRKTPKRNKTKTTHKYPDEQSTIFKTNSVCALSPLL